MPSWLYICYPLLWEKKIYFRINIIKLLIIHWKQQNTHLKLTSYASCKCSSCYSKMEDGQRRVHIAISSLQLSVLIPPQNPSSSLPSSLCSLLLIIVLLHLDPTVYWLNSNTTISVFNQYFYHLAQHMNAIKLSTKLIGLAIRSGGWVQL